MCNVVQLCLAANNILLMRKWSHAFLLLAIAFAWKWQIVSNPWVYSLRNNHGDRMIKQLLNSVIAKYRDFLCCSSLNVNQHYLSKSRHCCSRAISLLNWFNKVSKYTFSVNFFLYLCFISKHQCLILSDTEYGFSFPVKDTLEIFETEIDNNLNFF